MAKNLSERLLDMVEDDPRFIGLTASQVLAWLKIIRLVDRNFRRIGRCPETDTSWGEVRFYLRVSDDRLLTLIDNFHARGLLGYIGGYLGGFHLPGEVIRLLTSAPHGKRSEERSRQEFEQSVQSEESRRLRDASGGNL
jgi:hypothetical protein